MGSMSYHRGIIWPRYLRGGSSRADRGSVPWQRRGGGLTVILRFVDIVVVTTAIVGAAFTPVRYPSVWSLIARGGFALTYDHPCETSIFGTVVVIGNVLIVAIVGDISAAIFVVVVFSVVHSRGQQLRRQNHTSFFSVTISVRSL